MSDPNLITLAEAPGDSGRPRSLAGDAWHDLRRNRIFWASSVLVLLVLLMALIPSLFTSADPAACALSNQHRGPSGGALFGYDFQGCDVFARTVHGTRNSIRVGFLATRWPG